MPTASHRRGAGRQPSRRPLAIDLFAGAGGLSLGLEQAGFDIVTAVEYDPVHAATHEFNFPMTQTLCADISRQLEANDLIEGVKGGLAKHGYDPTVWDGEIDLIAGGPPCQGFSFIGKRLVDDARNRLVFHFFRLISELRPRYFVMENVPGMAQGGHAGILANLIDEFEDSGYRFPEDQKFEILNAADFGVPQERRRLFLLGSRRDQPNVALLPTPTVNPVGKRRGQAPGDNGSGLPTGPTVWDAIGDLPNPNRFPSLLRCDHVRLSDTAIGEMRKAASPYARLLNYMDNDPSDLSYRRRWDRSLLTSSTRTCHTNASLLRFKATKPGETETVSRFYRLDPGGLCNTLRAGSGRERGAFTSPRPLHPVSPRVLSNREAARLHSIPDWFRLHATKWHGFRQIGNAVAPLLGRRVGQSVIAALEVEPPMPDKLVALENTELLTLTMEAAANHFGVDSSALPAPRVRSSSSAGHNSSISSTAVIDGEGDTVGHMVAAKPTRRSTRNISRHREPVV